jgi:hypothetical protein
VVARNQLLFAQKSVRKIADGKTQWVFPGDFPPTFIATGKSPRGFSPRDFPMENFPIISTAPEKIFRENFSEKIFRDNFRSSILPIFSENFSKKILLFAYAPGSSPPPL